MGQERGEPDPDPLAAFEARLGALKREREAGLGERAASLEAAWRRWRAGQAEAAEEVRRLAHRIRGGAEGRAELAERAGAVETGIGEGAEALGARVEALLAEARRVAAEASARGEATGGGAPGSAAPGSAAQEEAEAERRAAPGSAAQQEAEAEHRAAPVSAKTELAPPRRALVVDDEPTILRLVSMTLERMGGFAVTTASTEREVRAALDEGAPFEVVLLDAMMPGTDGLTLCRLVRGHEAQGEARVVILSATSAEELGWDLSESGPDEWWRKPMAPTEVLARVRTLLDG
ncbi:MAG TPA: response regulator [Polyangiaceae bacterium LLY-WYZ-15_(1-7)]|nr:response regulator [Polyangiaceae bacterium LLY-WYZ-15_(1-7)]HJL07641.1 response regulator [Polyangiaceae bacterium LLY-WYZ-15_(1-7)]HJL22072.1 response regulator [Polyangiaceae bacterium LLY-WYZ-15_(1-7)]HJL36447.1 response regulator [Polyangiaceae bacterium LLY-WYZ-15_(1-7)]